MKSTCLKVLMAIGIVCTLLIGAAYASPANDNSKGFAYGKKVTENQKPRGPKAGNTVANPKANPKCDNGNKTKGTVHTTKNKPKFVTISGSCWIETTTASSMTTNTAFAHVHLRLTIIKKTKKGKVVKVVKAVQSDKNGYFAFKNLKPTTTDTAYFLKVWAKNAVPTTDTANYLKALNVKGIDIRSGVFRIDKDSNDKKLIVFKRVAPKSEITKPWKSTKQAPCVKK